jgi:hypothetical protein
MTALHVSRRDAPQLTPKELAAVTKSIQQFQLGEGSRGQRLLDRGTAYGNKVKDSCFASALELFIMEEQQHSRYLADFMESQDIPWFRDTGSTQCFADCVDWRPWNFR